MAVIIVYGYQYGADAVVANPGSFPNVAGTWRNLQQAQRLNSFGCCSFSYISLWVRIA